MLSPFTRGLVGAVLLPLAPVDLSSAAQSQSPAALARTRVVAMALRTSNPPTVDGTLDDPAWQAAKPLTDFTQTEPLEGQPASEKTEVRILYDDRFVYVGVICYDSDPSQIIVTDTRRDSSLTDMDSFQMIFDTYHDRQNGFVFGTNPQGTQYDAQVRDEGETQSGTGGPVLGRVQTGSGGGVNVNWDATWDVKTRVTDIGWTAEFSIPLRTLRYGPPPQVWSVNFMRNIQRKREKAYWSPVARQHTINRLSSAGDLRGLELKSPRNFKVTPYAVTSATKDFAAGTKASADGDWGLDAKLGLTPSVNLDLTYNTDFAQVEVDEQQINLTRFNLVFPEKRPFFLENAGLFSVGRSGDIDLFFSRRIGIDASGSLVPIKGGARVTGKTRGVNVGLLNMQTEDVGPTPANNYTAFRVNRDLPNRSSIGAIFTGRAATGGKAGLGDWNRTWGTDGKLGIGETVTFTGFAARTETPGRAGREYAYNGGAEYKDRNTRTYLEYGQTGESFNPEMGFLRRGGGYQRLSTGFFETVRTKWVSNAGFRELAPHFAYSRYSDIGGGLQSAMLHLDNHLDWENGNYISPGFNIDWEGLDVPFEVYPGVVVPPGIYRSPHTAFRTHTDRRKWVSVDYDWDYGGFLSGHQNSISPAITVRQSGTVSVSLRWTRNDIDLPQGAFVTNLGALRATYNFSTMLYAQVLVQYNDRTKRWSTNLRFNWLNTAGTGLYLVYNDTESLNGLGPVDRTFVVKYSRQFDVLH
jgi:hypothetical protein